MARTGRLVSDLLREDPGLHEMVEQFVNGLSGRIAALKRAFATLDWAELTALAHRLKGAGGSYGYPELSRLAARMEKEFRARRAEHFQTRLRELEKLIAAAQAGLQAG